MTAIGTEADVQAPPPADRAARPGQMAPPLKVRLAGGGDWNLADARPSTFTLVLFFRGNHCPACRAQLSELNRRLDEFTQRGVEVIAISGDTEALAAATVQDWHLDRLRLGYAHVSASMRRWGLFISHGHDGEPEWFNEPGLFLVKPDGEIFYAALNSMPFGRPHLDEILNGIGFVTTAGYPARGEA